MKEKPSERIFEIIPGMLSWIIITGILVLFFLKPVLAAIFLILYLVFWVCRLLYMSSLMVLAHHRMISKRDVDWLALCRGVKADICLDDVWHVVLYTVYNEPAQLIEESLTALKNTIYPKDKLIVVLAGEAREEKSFTKLEGIKNKFVEEVKDIQVIIHPKEIKEEIFGKGANATFAAKKIKLYLAEKGINLGKVIISCFDADTCPDKKYFSCLTYHFLSDPKRYQVSFQPLPIYNNNIYKVPAFARIIEMGSTFWQLIESMRYEKFITFSSHSMSFRTLVDVGYWPVDLISDDSLIFWKCFLKFKGDYRTYPLEVPVYMDIAVGRNILYTIAVQYKQKRRWAWGVETFAYAGVRFLDNKDIPWLVKVKRLLQLLDNHINWATWSIIISFITPAVLFWAKTMESDSLIFFNLSYIKSVIFHSLFFILLLCAFISKEFIPPRPKGVSPFIFVVFTLQWLFVPFVSAILGSMPALDAQTRFMLGGKFVFYPTPKRREDKSD
ncbi:MAG: glycosyltransferase family 2 protein [Candidatus Omnitrophica bacterium]|nr:glycosyltransferase family 2 protein [Candidatus Omnitrophota bacterium]